MRKKGDVTVEFDPARLPPLTRKQKAELKALAAKPDAEIDYSDIPPTSAEFWKSAERGKFYRPVKRQLTLRLDADVVAWFKRRTRGGRGYQTNINRALREYVLRRTLVPVPEKTQPMYVTRMNPYRFEALAMWSRAVPQFAPTTECSVWATNDERLLGVVIMDLTDQDYNFVILARDKHGRFRAVDVGKTYFTRRMAEIALVKRAPEVHVKVDTEFEQGDETGKRLDLFTPQMPKDQLHPNFLVLADGRAFSAAREIIAEMANAFDNPDGNFVRDFQTTGFNSRLWELYLFAALVEEGFKLDRSHAQPDFIASNGEQTIAIEATTVNPTIGDDGKPVEPPEPKNSNDLASIFRDYMPIKFGSPLFQKLEKKDWERKHVRGLPYIIAIADFHGPRTMTWSGSALSTYLFGVGVDFDRTTDGGLSWSYVPIKEHIRGEKRISSCFFDQRNAENISAVLFTNAGTLSKFNRMGVLADFGDPSVQLIRQGAMLNPDPQSAVPFRFSVNVDNPGYHEGWADELQVFHNPHALHPLDRGLFPKATHHFFKDGEIKSYSPPKKVLGSVTMVLLPKAGSDNAES